MISVEEAERAAVLLAWLAVAVFFYYGAFPEAIVLSIILIGQLIMVRLAEKIAHERKQWRTKIERD